MTASQREHFLWGTIKAHRTLKTYFYHLFYLFSCKTHIFYSKCYTEIIIHMNEFNQSINYVYI